MLPEQLGDKLHQVSENVQVVKKRASRAVYRGSSIPLDIEAMDEFFTNGLDTFPMVADSIFAPMDQYLMDRVDQGKANRWPLPSERSSPAVAAGRWLATGELSVMVMQNSGFSNAMEYLRTVMLVHKIPGFVLSMWRGHDAEIDDSEPHILVGDVTDIDNKNTVGKENVKGRRNGIGLLHDLRESIDLAKGGRLVCFRASPSGFRKSYPLREVTDAEIRYLDMDYYEARKTEKGRPFRKVQAEPLRTRDEAIKDTWETIMDEDPIVVTGNGYPPRTFQALRLTRYSFENAGGMGSSLAIAWGAAKSNPEQNFVAIDGDQNAVMSEMEKVLSSDYPPNLRWFILNNGTGESVGTARSLPLSPIHYDMAYVINTKNEKPGSFKYPRINASGLKFDTEEAQELARNIGNLPAQAHLGRRLLGEMQALREDRKREDAWTAHGILEGGFPKL
ncbi:MAG: hypothetical protein G01um101493_233 [Microgenomates group bacterium Gr01-1014_93]|nr:MAG: hypothetical protein G01um101493_233 [Microgenomates group bacterium Gr01-1014_93]